MRRLSTHLLRVGLSTACQRQTARPACEFLTSALWQCGTVHTCVHTLYTLTIFRFFVKAAKKTPPRSCLPLSVRAVACVRAPPPPLFPLLPLLRSAPLPPLFRRFKCNRLVSNRLPPLVSLHRYRLQLAIGTGCGRPVQAVAGGRMSN